MIVNHTTSDEELMKAYQNGNLLAFEILYERHKSHVLGYLMKKLRNRYAAEEVFQSTFMKLHSTRLQYDPSFKFPPWLFTICHNVLIDHLRKEKRRPSEETNSNVLNELPAPSITESSTIPALTGLDERQRSALEMRYMEDLDFDEIAKKLQTTSSNVRQLISRAIRKLRKHMNQEDL